MSTKIKGMVIIGGLLLALGWILYASHLRYSLYLPEIGDSVPEFELRSLTGSTVSLKDLLNDYDGVVINFFATWCPPCIEEMPSLLEFGKFLEKKNVVLVIVASDSQEKDVQEMAKKFGITSPILLDESAKVGEKYGITGYPETFVINKQGILVKKFIGPADWSDEKVRQGVLVALFHPGSSQGAKGSTPQ